MSESLLGSSSSLVPGTRFGAYEILERLGAGGMGEVYRARDTRLGREVALKTIMLDRSTQRDAIERFEQEARAASSLNHPNIVTIYELGQLYGTHYIAMELVIGRTVRDLLASGAIPFHQVADVAAQLSNALAKAHESGIAHRDLKPENVIISADGVSKIIDFGLAKLLFAPQDEAFDASTAIEGYTEEFAAQQQQPGTSDGTNRSPVTRVGAVVGSVGYMSPEQAM